MNKLTYFVSRIGQNERFVVFMDHSGVAAFVISRFTLGIIRYLAAIAAIILAAAKEFGFDMKYEQSPPQTLKDSALDFAGYITGILAGLFIP